METEIETADAVPQRAHGTSSRLRRFKRFLRRRRELIMIIATLALSVAFLLYGFVMALGLEAQHPTWFGHGY